MCYVYNTRIVLLCTVALFRGKGSKKDAVFMTHVLCYTDVVIITTVLQ